MSDLTLEHANTILFSAADAASAFASLSEFGYELKRIGTTHFLYLGAHVVMFFDGPVTHTLWIFIDDVLLKQPSLLESQQQPAATVPAVAAVEARPELLAACPRCDNPHADNLYHPEQEISYITCSKCGYDAPRDHIYTPAAEARPEFHDVLTCFCPSCDYDQATAQQDPEADFYHVNCSKCGLDADRDALELCLSFDPDTEFRNLMGFFTVLGNVATRDESYQRAFVHNLINNPHTHLHHLFDASLRMCLDAQLATLDQIAPTHLKAGA